MIPLNPKQEAVSFIMNPAYNNSARWGLGLAILQQIYPKFGEMVRVTARGTAAEPYFKDFGPEVKVSPNHGVNFITDN